MQRVLCKDEGRGISSSCSRDKCSGECRGIYFLSFGAVKRRSMCVWERFGAAGVLRRPKRFAARRAARCFLKIRFADKRRPKCFAAYRKGGYCAFGNASEPPGFSPAKAFCGAGKRARCTAETGSIRMFMENQQRVSQRRKESKTAPVSFALCRSARTDEKCGGIIRNYGSCRAVLPAR